MNANIDWDFISIMEGKAIKTGYHPSQNSGVTIGTGFDLKERTEEKGTMSDEEADELMRVGDINERKNK